MRQGPGSSALSLVLLVVVVLAAILPGIAALPPLDRDESRYVQATRQMVESGNYVDIRFQETARYKKPVGIYWLQSAAVALTGDPGAIWAYRLVSTLGILLAAIGLWWAGNALFGAPAGLAAGIVLTILFGVVLEGHIAKTDAMLIGIAVFAQGALARIHARMRAGGDIEPVLPWIFWTALGAGILIKGPIVPLLALTTLAGLWLFERDLGWLRALKPGRGILLAALIALPWLIAISWTSGGAFWREAVGTDMAAKLVGGQESHGAPPGYFLLTYGLYAWPAGPLLLAAGLAVVARMRADPRLLFLFCWYVPFSLLFEVIPTKLPHYTLPAYPALALAAGWAVASALDLDTFRQRGWRLWLFRIAAAGQALVTLALAAIAVAGPLWLGDGFSAAGLLAALLVVAAGAVGIAGAYRFDLRHLVAGAALTIAAYALIFAAVLPGFTRIWLSPRIAEAVAEAAPSCDTPRLAAVSYHEPSLVFLAGTDTALTDLDGAAARIAADPQCALALVPVTEGEALAQRLAATGLQPALRARIDGINYSKGREVSLGLYGAETR